MSLALSYERAHTPSLEGFLDWLARGGTEIKRDMEHGRDEVRVMTVHGAKGLEADIVILPDTTGLPRGPSRKGHLPSWPDGLLYPLPNGGSTRRNLAAKHAEEEETLASIAVFSMWRLPARANGSMSAASENKRRHARRFLV